MTNCLKSYPSLLAAIDDMVIIKGPDDTIDEVLTVETKNTIMYDVIVPILSLLPSCSEWYVYDIESEENKLFLQDSTNPPTTTAAGHLHKFINIMAHRAKPEESISLIKWNNEEFGYGDLNAIYLKNYDIAVITMSYGGNSFSSALTTYFVGHLHSIIDEDSWQSYIKG